MKTPQVKPSYRLAGVELPFTTEAYNATLAWLATNHPATFDLMFQSSNAPQFMREEVQDGFNGNGCLDPDNRDDQVFYLTSLYENDQDEKPDAIITSIILRDVVRRATK